MIIKMNPNLDVRRWAYHEHTRSVGVNYLAMWMRDNDSWRWQWCGAYWGIDPTYFP